MSTKLFAYFTLSQIRKILCPERKIKFYTWQETQNVWTESKTRRLLLLGRNPKKAGNEKYSNTNKYLRQHSLVYVHINGKHYLLYKYILSSLNITFMCGMKIIGIYELWSTSTSKQNYSNHRVRTSAIIILYFVVLDQFHTLSLHNFVLRTPGPLASWTSTVRAEGIAKPATNTKRTLQDIRKLLMERVPRENMTRNDYTSSFRRRSTNISIQHRRKRFYVRWNSVSSRGDANKGAYVCLEYKIRLWHMCRPCHHPQTPSCAPTCYPWIREYSVTSIFGQVYDSSSLLRVCQDETTSRELESFFPSVPSMRENVFFQPCRPSHLKQRTQWSRKV